MKKKNKEPEYDPKDGVLIDDDNIFGWTKEDDKIEDFGDFTFKYLRPFYRLFINYIPDFRRWVTRVGQRIFRKNHLANVDIWNMSHELAPKILKRLEAFYAQEQSGHPMYFSEWGYEGCTDEYGGMGLTKEEYDKKRVEGDFGGGGMEAWKATIKEMIFAFEYNIICDSGDRREEEFYKKWGLLNPYRETEDNLSWGYSFRGKDGHSMGCGQCDVDRRDDIKDFEKEGYTLISKHRAYIDMPLLKEYRERIDKGMELFGKFYWNLWD